MTKMTSYSSPLGEMLLAAEDDKLIGAWFKDARYYGSTLGSDREWADNDPVLKRAAAWLDAYFSRSAPDPDALNLRIEGSDFRRNVLDALRRIPYGRTTTYGAIAAEIAGKTGRQVSAQAVGGAVGHNPLTIFIPCHRVLGTDGSLTGYAGGLHRKQMLLRLESEEITR